MEIDDPSFAISRRNLIVFNIAAIAYFVFTTEDFSLSIFGTDVKPHGLSFWLFALLAWLYSNWRYYLSFNELENSDVDVHIRHAMDEKLKAMARLEAGKCSSKEETWKFSSITGCGWLKNEYGTSYDLIRVDPQTGQDARLGKNGSTETKKGYLSLSKKQLEEIRRGVRLSHLAQKSHFSTVAIPFILSSALLAIIFIRFIILIPFWKF